MVAMAGVPPFLCHAQLQVLRVTTLDGMHGKSLLVAFLVVLGTAPAAQGAPFDFLEDGVDELVDDLQDVVDNTAGDLVDAVDDTIDTIGDVADAVEDTTGADLPASPEDAIDDVLDTVGGATEDVLPGGDPTEGTSSDGSSDGSNDAESDAVMGSDEEGAESLGDDNGGAGPDAGTSNGGRLGNSGVPAWIPIAGGATVVVIAALGAVVMLRRRS